MYAYVATYVCMLLLLSILPVRYRKVSHVCMYVCMYVRICMYVCVYMYVF